MQFRTIRDSPQLNNEGRNGMNLEYVAVSLDNGKSIKDILTSYLQISHRLLVTLKNENCIFLNGAPAFVYKTVNCR